MSKRFLTILFLIVLGFNSYAQSNDIDANKAIALIKELKFTEALSLGKSVLEKEPNHTNANYACGAACFWLNKYADAEPYLVEAEKKMKTKAQVYIFLGTAYFANRSTNKNIEIFNTTKAYYAKAEKLDSRIIFTYENRARVYMYYYGISGLINDAKEKDQFFSDLKQMIVLGNNFEGYLYDYAKYAFELNDFGLAILGFTKFLDHPNVNLEYSTIVCKNAERLAELANSDSKYGSKKAYPNLWNNAIALMKACKKSTLKLETNENAKKEKLALFRKKTIEYIQLKADMDRPKFLDDPAYLEELNDGIAAGETNYYSSRIEVYTHKKLYAKAEADKKSKLIAEEKNNIKNYIAEEEKERQKEVDFRTKRVNAEGDLSFEDFKTSIGWKKNRLFLLNKIITFNIPDNEKDVFIKRRDDLVKFLAESEIKIANYDLRELYSEKVKEYNIEVRKSNYMECLNADAAGAQRCNYKRAGYLESAVYLLKQANGKLYSMKPEPTFEINENLTKIKKMEETIIKFKRGY